MKPNLVFLVGILGPDDNWGIDSFSDLTQISEENFLFRSELEVSILKYDAVSLTDHLIQYQIKVEGGDLRHRYPPILLLDDLYRQGYSYKWEKSLATNPYEYRDNMRNKKLLMCVDLNTVKLAEKLRQDYLPQVDQLITYLGGIQLAQQRDEKLELLLGK